MTYVKPFTALKGKIGMKSVNGELKVSMSFEDLKTVIRSLLIGVAVDEDWYCREYPDVAAAIAAGDVRSAKHHFVEEGYFEGRLPGPTDVDERWYLAQYEDVAQGIADGHFLSARAHFHEHGHDEGRLPKSFY